MERVERVQRVAWKYVRLGVRVRVGARVGEGVEGMGRVLGKSISRGTAVSRLSSPAIACQI